MGKFTDEQKAAKVGPLYKFWKFSCMAKPSPISKKEREEIEAAFAASLSKSAQDRWRFLQGKRGKKFYRSSKARNQDVLVRFFCQLARALDLEKDMVVKEVYEGGLTEKFDAIWEMSLEKSLEKARKMEVEKLQAEAEAETAASDYGSDMESEESDTDAGDYESEDSDTETVKG